MKALVIATLATVMATEIVGTSRIAAKCITRGIARIVPRGLRDWYLTQWLDDLQCRSEQGMRVTLFLIIVGFLFSAVNVRTSQVNSTLARSADRMLERMEDLDRQIRVLLRFPDSRTLSNTQIRADLVWIGLLFVGQIPFMHFLFGWRWSTIFSDDPLVVAGYLLTILVLMGTPDFVFGLFRNLRKRMTA